MSSDTLSPRASREPEPTRKPTNGSSLRHEKFQALFDAVPDPAWVLDEEGTIEEVNREFVEGLDYDRDEIVGRSIDELPFLSEAEREAAVEIFALRMQGETFPPFPFEYQKKDGSTGFAEINARPLRKDGEIVGEIGIARDITDRKRREDELEAARRELKEANEKLQKQSREDVLTGLPNKRHFNEILDREWARGRREGKRLSLIMADLDDFKGYNDAYGHEAGDEVLRSLGSVFRTVLKRPGDFPARWGGEEFTVILSGTDAEGAAVVAEKLRRAVENLKLQHETSSVADVATMSFGTATLLPTEEYAPGELVKRADAALYRSKDRGKNCVTPFDAV